MSGGKVLQGKFDPESEEVTKAREAVKLATGLYVEAIEGFGSFISGAFNVRLRTPPEPSGELLEVTIPTPAKFKAMPTWYEDLPLELGQQVRPKPSGDDAGRRRRLLLDQLRQLTVLDSSGEANDATWIREFVASNFTAVADLDDVAHGRGVAVGPLVYEQLVDRACFVQGGKLYLFLDHLELTLTQVRQRIERNTLIALLKRAGFTRDDKRAVKKKKSKTRSVYTIPLADLEHDDDVEEED